MQICYEGSLMGESFLQTNGEAVFMGDFEGNLNVPYLSNMEEIGAFCSIRGSEFVGDRLSFPLEW